MSVLSTTTLRRRIYGLDGTGGDIHITPLLDVGQVAHSAVDIRLGRHFIVTRSTRLPSLDVMKMTDEGSVATYQELIYVEFGDSFVLQAGYCALGSVLEYVSIPENVYAEVLTRSSWGRVDLTIATAVCVHPGYSGCLTLELVNMSDAAILLYPGTRVGQLVFHETDDPDPDAAHRGKYAAPTRPQFPKLHREVEELRKFSAVGLELKC
ncbi:MAG: dCTP deaminase [Coriobacteriia bacterium]|nr:dCTP deaminase [Coriobacteriia bacterium]